MASNFAGLPHFNRTSLWLIIVLLIPMITILNQTDKKPEIEDKQITKLHFPLPDLEIVRSANDTWVELPGSGQIILSIITENVPSNRVKVPSHQDFKMSIRDNKAVTRVVTPSEQAALEVTLEFLHSWLPELTETNTIVISGEVDQKLLDTIRIYLQSATGNSIKLVQANDSYVTRIQVPDMGSSAQLAFVISAEIIRKRIVGYQPKLTWDHTDSISYLDLNTTLKPEWLTDASDEEFETVHQRMIELASDTDRSPNQIHRYLETIALYNTPPEFIQQQSRLLKQITIEQINQQIAQIKSALKPE